MIQGNMTGKYVRLHTDHEKDNAAFTAVAVDTRGFDYAEIICIFQAIPAHVAALKVEESDNDSDYSDVAVIGTAKQITGDASSLPQSTDDNKNWLFNLDLRHRKRYLRVPCTAGDGSGTVTEMTAIARLSRSGLGMTTAAQVGAAQVIQA